MEANAIPNEILSGIADRAAHSDRTGEWPSEDLAQLASIGAMRWAIPSDAGGDGLSPLEIYLRYEQIATASLATALILSQRDSAAGSIDGSANPQLRSSLLIELLHNRAFSTVGIAQVTTSRQHGAPALMATPTQDGYRLQGFVPWATGADQCDFIVVASPVSEGGQLLFALPRGTPGVTILPPQPIVAMAATRTTSIELDAVQISHDQVLTSPSQQSLVTRRKGLPIGQSFLALGLCRSALNLIAAHRRSNAESIAGEFEKQFAELRGKVLTYSTTDQPEPAMAPVLRGSCNDLAVRITHAAVALYKGTALRMDHPAQRLAREAMFLLVWSCPDPVIHCTVELLVGE